MKSARLRIALILLIILVAASPIWFTGKAQDEGGRYYPETGHSVSQAVQLEVVNITGEGRSELLYGYPITGEIPKTATLSYQYFQKIRFEIDKSIPGFDDVQRSEVGRLVYEAYRSKIEQSKAVLIPPNYSSCETFGQRSLRVCKAFLSFYIAQGGMSQFGEPLTEAIEVDNGVIMQYFVYGRLEYYPNNPPGFQVKVSDLGRILFDLERENQINLWAQANNARPQVISSLHAQAFTAQGSQKFGTQVLDVIVTDQSGLPVPGCEVNFSVFYPNGEEKAYRIRQQTNEHGIATIEFDTNADAFDTKSGTIEITLTVILPNGGAGDLRTATSTSFYRGY